MDLLQAWGDWKRNRSPFVLESDHDKFSSPRSALAVITIPNWPGLSFLTNWSRLLSLATTCLL
jgi:hypothetical protein